jgi:predicted AAA+ superfamily ATPase
MSMSNVERVARALELLDGALRTWSSRVLQGPAPEGAVALLDALLADWSRGAAEILGEPGRRLVEDLRAHRLRVDARGRYDADDAYRALDDVARLLAAIAARDESAEVDRHRQELLRARFDQEALKESRRGGTPELKGTPIEGLRPWRDVMTPHPDVARGTFQSAEFAADLWQVVTGDASEEYLNPVEFFRRTYLTEGLRQLLGNALRRLSGGGGDPVIELQTTFGGGKTHSMLALYHLFSGVAPTTLPGMEELLREVGASAAIPARRAVLVGNKLSPGQPEVKDDGTRVRTMWGELAWQIGGREAYDLIREADESATNPGDALRKLFARYAPCVVLIDEWVAYARQLVDRDLPGGTFETHFTFAQQLSEAAKAAPRTLLVVSIPASEHQVKRGRGGERMETVAQDIEVGGARGHEALERLKNAIGRVESPWRPASAEETYEIVRRRLFESITDPSRFAARDAVIKRFMELYRATPQDFPSECREKDYERKLLASYPLHPELFDRLAGEWSSLPRFQRTRGVLRLMATVIHRLFHEGDRALMILPASIPLGARDVQSELARYLDEPWTPVIERDIDGPAAVAFRIDEENVQFGRYSAARRVARSVFMATAPMKHAAHAGVEEKHIRLGCAQPGETPATFTDALRRLAERGRHFYVEGARYWFNTQATVSRLADDRAAEIKADIVAQHVVERLKEHFKKPPARGEFSAVYVAPRKSADVPEERETALVVLDPDDPHSPGAPTSPARTRAQEILDQHGNGKRRYRNRLMFLAADKRRLPELLDAARTFLAWEGIVADATSLDLTNSQRLQAEQRRRSADETVLLRLHETWSVGIVPEQEHAGPGAPPGEVAWREVKLPVAATDPLGVKLSRKAVTEGLLQHTVAGTVLRMHLDRVPLWRGDHVSVKTLVDDFATYLYLERVTRPEVILEAIRSGLGNTAWSTETFAYAERYDATTKRYLGLVTNTAGLALGADAEGLIVRGDVASRQMKEDAEARAAREALVRPVTPVAPTVTPGGSPQGGSALSSPPASPAPPTLPRSFRASVDLEVAQLGERADVIAKEVLRHLAALPGAKVTVTLEVHATAPEGISTDLARVVKENCRTLGVHDIHFDDR